MSRDDEKVMQRIRFNFLKLKNLCIRACYTFLLTVSPVIDHRINNNNVGDNDFQSDNLSNDDTGEGYSSDESKSNSLMNKSLV
ncbi:hypothetical protein ABEB36_005517 [Hypothenemus hampei]|uniref:Uncharacterized protein n=1 Tax=Hypothenemus hampei TaxID=57062 RepID=A0ABD1EYG5_HYPHA